jgi:hypothetical protein
VAAERRGERRDEHAEVGREAELAQQPVEHKKPERLRPEVRRD